MSGGFGFDKPRIITWGELLRVMMPRIQGYAWAMDTIGDLWAQCTPVPDQIVIPGQEHKERRIIRPSQFAAWWGDVAGRMGYSEGPAEVLNA